MKQFFSWRSAVLDSELASGPKLVLLVISTYMNDHGQGAYPSQATIARKASMSKRSVTGHIDAAVAAGWLVKQIHGFSGQGWRRNEYVIAFPETEIKGGAEFAPRSNNEKVVQKTTKGGANNDKKVVQNLHPTYCNSNTVKNSLNEKEQNNEKSTTNSGRKKHQKRGNNNRQSRTGNGTITDGAQLAIDRHRNKARNQPIA